MKCPRLLVSAPHGRSGKTTACLAIAAALVARGIEVQPFKKGPDYIDPGWLADAAGRPCRTLDLFLMDPDTVLAAFTRAARPAGFALVEGAHGLFDGLDAAGTNSTAHLAKLLGIPVVLVVDATRMTYSVAALARGFAAFDPDVRVAGVILNQVASARHRAKLTDALHAAGVRPLGALPRDAALGIADRHLGLVPNGEDPALRRVIAELARAGEAFLDLPALLDIARSAGPLDAPVSPPPGRAPATVRIGVARDRAFSFYYGENLEALEREGAELVRVDTLADRTLPDVDALYLGGGFPEVFLDALAANAGLQREIRDAAREGLPVYAECGGLMYLARSISWQGRSVPMAGVLPCDVAMTSRPAGHGYVRARVARANPYFAVGTELRGHEFHHSRVRDLDRATLAYRLARGTGVRGGEDGIVVGNVLAAYTHVHAAGAPGWARAIVERAGAFHDAPALAGRETR